MSTNDNPAVVVGVDEVGHRFSSVALRYAAAEARARRTGIVVVHGAAEDATSRARRGTTPSAERLAHGEQVVAAAARVLRRLVGGDVPLTLRSTPDTGVESLLAASETAGLVVVQRQAGSTLNRLLAGSTASTVAAQARCPVVVVHADDHPVEPGGVVVGVDQRGHSGAAVLQAVAEASWREVSLTAVQAWEAPLDSPPHLTYVPADASERRAARDAAERSLAESLAGLQARYPDVEIHRKLVHGDAVAALLDASTDAQLLVVGRHTSPHLASFGLGQVARLLIGRASCPVMVVAPNARDQHAWETLLEPRPIGTTY